jgi:hypothetical protein
MFGRRKVFTSAVQLIKQSSFVAAELSKSTGLAASPEFEHGAKNLFAKVILILILLQSVTVSALLLVHFESEHTMLFFCSLPRVAFHLDYLQQL